MDAYWDSIPEEDCPYDEFSMERAEREAADDWVSGWRRGRDSDKRHGAYDDDMEVADATP
jgi:hypothetical protein